MARYGFLPLILLCSVYQHLCLWHMGGVGGGFVWGLQGSDDALPLPSSPPASLPGNR